MPIEDIAAQWSQETGDESWTSEIETHLRNVIADLELRASVRLVDCRASLCRIQLVLEDSESANALADAAMSGDESIHLETFPSPNSESPFSLYLERSKPR